MFTCPQLLHPLSSEVIPDPALLSQGLWYCRKDHCTTSPPRPRSECAWRFSAYQTFPLLWQETVEGAQFFFLTYLSYIRTMFLSLAHLDLFYLKENARGRPGGSTGRGRTIHSCSQRPGFESCPRSFAPCPPLSPPYHPVYRTLS